nr:hypothetical protein [Brevibacillus marinus]
MQQLTPELESHNDVKLPEDKGSEQRIIALLQRHVPAHSIFSEEAGFVERGSPKKRNLLLPNRLSCTASGCCERLRRHWTGACWPMAGSITSSCSGPVCWMLRPAS